jgi:hypothetical protein
MECFVHPGAVAVGFCRNCGKGICRNCAREVGLGLVCASERCAKSAAEDEIIRERTLRACGIDGGKRKPNLLVIMFTVFGLIFSGFGIYVSLIRQQLEFFPIALGAAFLALALFVYLQVRALFRNRQDSMIPSQDGGQGGQHGNE